MSLSVNSLEDLEAAAVFYNEHNIDNGEFKDLGPGFAIHVMAVRDPDNIQLELTALYAA